MSKQLYEEALADVKKLKEIAEDNAKKALIEAVSPRIKDLIEAELLREASDEESKEDILTDDSLESTVVVPATDEVPVETDPSVAAAMSSPDEEGKVTLDLDDISVEPSTVYDQYELSNESIKLLNPIVEKLNASTALKIESKLFQLNEAVEKFLEASISIKKTANYQRKILEMVSEIETVYEYLQESAGNLQDKGVYEGKLEKLYQQLNKLVERYNMKKNLKSLTEAEITLKLTNVPDEVGDQLDDLGVDLVTDEAGEEPAEEESEEGGDELDLSDEEGSAGEGEEEGESEELDLGDEEEKAEEAQKMESKRLSYNTIVEIDENMLRREIARMRSLREAADDAQSWGHGPGDVSDEFEDEEMGDPFVDIDLSESQDQQDEMDDRQECGEMDELDQEIDEMDELDQEIDEMDELDQEIDEMNELDQEMDELDQMLQGQQQKKQQGQQQKKQQGQQQQKKQEGQQQKKQQGQQQKKQQGMHQYGEVDDKEEEQQEMEEAGDHADAVGPGGASNSQERRTRNPGAPQEQQQVQEALRRLAREARLQTEAKKKAQAAKKQQKEAQQKAQKKQQEAQQKMKQKRQQEAQKAKQEAQKQAKQAKKMQEAYAYYANIFNESVRRTAKLQSVLAESRNEARLNGASTRSTDETSTLRKKLAETNLFNTKLLYCNKLLQNESLTKRQKADIIERLDEASSEREVKLVYESLVKTLATPSRSLAEGARPVLGSSSQATRPASTVLSEGYEADRWAKLAGLK